MFGIHFSLLYFSSFLCSPFSMYHSLICYRWTSSPVLGFFETGSQCSPGWTWTLCRTGSVRSSFFSLLSAGNRRVLLCPRWGIFNFKIFKMLLTLQILSKQGWNTSNFWVEDQNIRTFPHTLMTEVALTYIQHYKVFTVRPLGLLYNPARTGRQE